MSIALRATFMLFILASVAPAAAPPTRAGTPKVARLLRQLDAENFHTRQRADEALRALGKPMLPVLRAEVARTKSLEVRWRLNRIIDDLTVDDRIPALVQMLGHSNVQFRDQADWALRRVGVSAVPLLKQQLKPTLPGESRRRLERIIAELSSRR